MSTAVTSQISELQEIATELFGGEVRVEQVQDPEIPEREQAVFHVTASGTVEEVTQHRLEWYRRTMQLLGDDYAKVALAISLVDDDR